jgi:hypothetical protein
MEIDMAATAPITGAPAGEPTFMVKTALELDNLALNVGLSLDLLAIGIGNVSIASAEDRQYFSCIETARLMLEQVKRDLDAMYGRAVH